MCQIELSDRLSSLATSLTGCRSISFNKRCCSASVHSRCDRLDRTPMRRANFRQAHLGFIDSSTKCVTRRLSSLPLALMFARTRSRAALDQRYTRREMRLIFSSMSLISRSVIVDLPLQPRFSSGAIDRPFQSSPFTYITLQQAVLYWHLPKRMSDNNCSLQK